MQRILQIDYLKGLAIIFVILIHTMTVKQLDFIGAPYYILQAVPVFLFLFGYNTTHSYVIRGMNNLKSCYERAYLTKRIKKILVPYAYIWILQLLVIIILKMPITKQDIIYNFIIGGWGPGGYFIPIILQLILIIPLLYKAAQYNRYFMLISSFIINMGFELFSYYANISNSIYRVVAIRYLFIVALGVYLALYEIKNRKILFVGALFSLIYITSINYFGLNLPVFHAWKSQNAPSFVWPFVLVLVGLNKLPAYSRTFIGLVLAKIGQRSYHIFLFQSVFFIFLPNVTRHLKSYFSITLYFTIPVNILSCVFLGIAFYYCENKISNFLNLYKQK
ncbi:acyltransferase family protein [Clostridium estertheticum]|uniref:acyltransferase family protein n=1 Tax=Clostridium estertheticum TaxID=238834 RepID=UPI0013E9087E|nr:acyltransferase family protein [Clostridium estertheticum]MBZ9688903.1 acyltransferase family protein [Clostridium estertheticum]